MPDRVYLDYLLTDTPDIAVILDTGEKIKGHVIEVGQAEIFLETALGKLLIPERSIKYYIIEEPLK